MVFQKYDIDSFANATSGNPLVHYVQEVSSQTNYIPGILLLVGFYFVIFLSLKLRGGTTPGVFAVTNFVNMILAILFFALGIIPGYFLVISIIIFPVSLFMLFVMEG